MQEELQRSGLPFMCVYTWSFYENFVTNTFYQKQDDGELSVSFSVDASKLLKWHSRDSISAADAGQTLPTLCVFSVV